MAGQDKLDEAKARIAGIPEDLRAAHKHCSRHFDEVMRSELCGCFYCLKTFPPSEIKEWVDKAQTAICPHCSIDSVLGDASGLPLTEEFLKKMQEHWF